MIKIIKKILATFLFNLFNLICYEMKHDTLTVYTYIVICVRTYVYTYSDDIKKNYHAPFTIPLLAILIQLAVGVSVMESYWQLIPVLTSCYVCYYLWYYDTTQKLRIGNMITNTAWFIYNLISGLYIIATARLIITIINTISYKKHEEVEV